MVEQSGKIIEARSHLGPSVMIKGDIEGSEDLIVDGQIEGNVTLRGCRLIVSPSARLKGNINAGEIILEGNVEGNLVATGRVMVKARAILLGDITASRVAIEDGAKFKGTIKIISK